MSAAKGSQNALGNLGNPFPKSNLPINPETNKPEGGPGRPKGMQNVTTNLPKALLSALAESFEEQGSKAFLNKLAQENPKAYAALLARLLPSIVQTLNKEGDAVPLAISINFEKPKE